MANPTLIKTLTAEGAIAARRLVALGSGDGQVVQAAASTDALLGVSGELAAADAGRVDIVLAGLAEVECGGTIARGAPVTADAAGKAVTAVRHTHQENTAASYQQNATTAAGSAERTIGIALESAVAGDVIHVLISPSWA